MNKFDYDKTYTVFTHNGLGLVMPKNSFSDVFNPYGYETEDEAIAAIIKASEIGICNYDEFYIVPTITRSFNFSEQ